MDQWIDCIASCLTRLSEDVWVGHGNSGGEVTSSVLGLKLPRDKLGLLALHQEPGGDRRQGNI